MKQKYLVLPQFFVAFLILAVSIYKASSVEYAFSQAPSPTPSQKSPLNINYQLPNPEITPESPLWPMRALIDKTDSSAESYLENADIRLVSGQTMVAKGKVEEGYVVLEKAEQYLQESYNKAIQLGNSDRKNGFLYKLSLASLKHREVLEEVLSIAPDDGRPVVTRIMDTPKKIYEDSSFHLELSGNVPPVYPF